jgi:hypothetical protein
MKLMSSEFITTDEETSWPWPFSRADLTAGLRRYLSDLSIQVSEARPLTIARRRPSIGVLRGVRVTYSGQEGEETCNLVVKEPRGTTRTGLAGVGRREVGVYQFLAGQMPMTLPLLIGASSSGDWIMLEAVPPVRDAAVWEKDDYLNAIIGLADLHDRFWGLGEDLDAFPWLSRPLTADFEVHVTVGKQSIEQIAFGGAPESLAKVPERMEILQILIDKADEVASPLRKRPRTLLHGDYWPGNISVLKDGEQVVYDWQLTGIGPAILDLLVFVKKSEWWFDSLPISEEEIVARYRETVKSRVGVVWEGDEWDVLWDHALMWRFMQEWFDLLAASPEPILAASEEQLERVWLIPVTQAVNRRLSVR